MKKVILLLLIFAQISISACNNDSSSEVSSSEFSLSALQTNYETNPLGIESPNPLFSWKIQSVKAAYNQAAYDQAAYQISVKSDNGDLVWDSGKIKSAESVAIEYQGENLEPTTQYIWEVKVWNEQDQLVQNSAWFETGLMNPDQTAWSGAQWIGGDAHDQVFQSSYLSVFRLNVDIQLDESNKSTRAAILLGGNDFRLQNKNLNLLEVENKQNESFIAFELDTRGLDQASHATINLYRVAYAPEDSINTPIATLAVPKNIINKENRYQKHRLYIDSSFGIFNIFVDGQTSEQRITEHNPKLPYFIYQGLNLNPYGSGRNYISYPMLGDIGFWVEPKQKAKFSSLEVRHWRSPSNTLFAAASPKAKHYPEIFLDKTSHLKELEDGSYEFSAEDKREIVLADPSRNGTPLLRHAFSLENKDVKSARLYVTARGIYEIYLNGERVGEDYFAPGLTQYNKHHTYQVYDITSELKTSDNVIGAILGEGWWSGNVSFMGTNWNFFGDQQSLLAKMVVTYTDGSQQEIVSAPNNWKIFHGGPLRYGSFFQGEIYDAQQEQHIDGWSTPSYDDSTWKPAQLAKLENSAFIGNPAHDHNNQLITSYDDMKLITHVGNSPKIVKTLKAQSVNEVRPGVFVYDMGQNMVGFPRIKLKADDVNTDEPIVLRYAEVLYPDLPEYKGNEGTLMIENLRAALVHDIYYPKEGEQTIQPRFTFHGYRYLEISGVSSAPSIDDVEGLVISSVDTLTAHFESSNDRVNKLWENITWSLRSNFLSIPTDTPARNERLGWSGDINVFASTANYMTHSNAFITRHMMAMRDLQSKEGRFPDVTPIGGGFGGTMWGVAGITVAWETYRQYGDISLLKNHYSAMVAYLNYLDDKTDPETGLLVEGYLGDWLSPEGSKNDNSLLWEAYRIHALEILSRVAAILDNPEDAKSFQEKYEARKAFFNDTYVDPDTGKTIASGVVSKIGHPITINPELKGQLIDTQTSYALPLAMGIFDETNRVRAEQHLITSVERENTDDQGDTHPPYSLMTGFIGTRSLLEGLSLADADQQAYKVLQQTTYPSLLYPVINGATTIWERLNSYTVENGFGGNNSMNSFNHYAFGAVGSWMMSHSLGIGLDDQNIGYRKFSLTPSPDPTGEMTWAKGHYDSMYGRIESSWNVDDKVTTYHFTVPNNTSATLRLPVKENQKIVQHSQEARFISEENGRAIYVLSAGKYKFTVELEKE